MQFRSIGDLSQSYMMNRQSAASKHDVARLSQELASGLKSNVGAAVGTDFSILSGLERALTLIDSYSRATTEARVFTDAAQAALGVVQDELGDIGPALLMSANNGNATLVSAASADAKQRITTVISALNTAVSGRHLFSGQDTDRMPLQSAEAMLDAIRPAVQVAQTPQEMLMAVDAWFAPGGGFDAQGYRGSDTPVAGFQISQNTKVAMDTTAAHDDIRSTLAALTKAALVMDTPFVNDAQAKRAVMEGAAMQTLAAQGAVAIVRSELGAAQEAIAMAEARSGAERSALQIDRAGILSADPYETATAFQQATTQLESLYLITSRVSRLKLTDFIR
jgi:flagellar hook-associated protein 3 FlgL